MRTNYPAMNGRLTYCLDEDKRNFSHGCAGCTANIAYKQNGQKR